MSRWSRDLEPNELERPRFFIVGHRHAVIEHLSLVAVLEPDLRSLSEYRRREIVKWRVQYERLVRKLLRACKEAGLI